MISNVNARFVALAALDGSPSDANVAAAAAAVTERFAEGELHLLHVLPKAPGPYYRSVLVRRTA